MTRHRRLPNLGATPVEARVTAAKRFATAARNREARIAAFMADPAQRDLLRTQLADPQVPIRAIVDRLNLPAPALVKICFEQGWRIAQRGFGPGLHRNLQLMVDALQPAQVRSGSRDKQLYGEDAEAVRALRVYGDTVVLSKHGGYLVNGQQCTAEALRDRVARVLRTRSAA